MGKLAKLRGMSAEEVRHRLRERVRMAADKAAFLIAGSPGYEEPPWVSLPARLELQVGRRLYDERGEFSVRLFLENVAGPRFYFDPSQAGRHRRLFGRLYPAELNRVVEEAERICRHRLPLLGHGEVALGEQIDWHRDPLTGQAWPVRFWADYDLVGDNSLPDPKIIHELNRHQHLPRLAMACFLTGEERYGREAVGQLESWMAQNPAGEGVNWHSSLEIGLRVISWLWTMFFLLPSPVFEERVARAMTESMVAQLQHIARYPSIYSSPNTHLVGEAAALFLAGVLLEPLAAAAEWRRAGASLLASQAARQILPDGVYGELSSYYHCYALDFYLQAVVLADRTRSPLPENTRRAVERMAGFLMHLTDPGGSIPLLGDDDGGRALALHLRDGRDFRGSLAACAVLFRRPDFKHVAGEAGPELFWLLGEEGGRAFAELGAAVPGQTAVAFPAAGYFIQRSGWTPDAARLVFDCGGMGMAGGAHSHADALSITLSCAGTELLADPGTFIYNRAPEWRNFFRSARAHSTAVIDGSDQSAPGGTFSWKTRAAARLRRHFSPSGLTYVEAEHDGFERLPEPVVHRRRLLFAQPDYWLVLDDFRGQGEHRFDLLYHFAPRAEMEIRNGGSACLELVARAGEASGRPAELFLALCATAPLEAEMICGREGPPQGWLSRAYGVKAPAPVLRAGFHSRAPAAALSFLLSRAATGGDARSGTAAARPRLQRLASPAGTMACALEHGSFRDVVVFAPSRELVEVDRCRLRGEFFWLRAENRVLKQLFATDALGFHRDGRAVFESEQPMPGVTVRFSGDRSVIEELGTGDQNHVRYLRDRELRVA